MPRMTFIARDGTAQEVDTSDGRTLLQIARTHAIDIEGACEGNMACATCHLVVEGAWYDRLPAPSNDEEDMLDLAYGLTATSRLGCQITLTADLDGLVVRLSETGENF
jgi:2Fe-2S ferredoxin